MLDVLGYIYQEIIKARNTLYRRRLLEVHDLGARTISVGNITTGGTGKTPLVAHIAELLIGRGEKVCILTRGHGREDPKRRILVSDGIHVRENDPRKTGDEPLELANKLQGKAVVIADADRVAAAEWVRRKFGVTFFILDDGFQHRRAKRDVDVVCIDATRPLGEMRMLPAGRLREPLSGLVRADVIVLTRADLVEREAISNLRSEISNVVDDVPVFEASARITGLREIEAGTQGWQSESGARLFAFCGLGNPETFFEGLKRNGRDVRGIRAFADHHRYSQKDIVTLETEAGIADCEALVTTAKDAVKLSEVAFTMPCFVAEIEVKIDDEAVFSQLIYPT